MRQQSPPPRRDRRQSPPKRGSRSTSSSPKTEQRRKPTTKPVQIKGLAPNTEVRKRKNVYYVIHKTKRKLPWRLIIALIIVFIGAIGSAYSYAQIYSVQQEINESRNDLNNQRVTNRNLESHVTRNYSREEIERLAWERLDMRPPDPSQIIYFHLPNQSGVMMSTYIPQTPTQENYFWQGIVAFFSGIRERIFS